MGDDTLVRIDDEVVSDRFYAEVVARLAPEVAIGGRRGQDFDDDDRTVDEAGIAGQAGAALNDDVRLLGRGVIDADPRSFEEDLAGPLCLCERRL